MRELRMKRDARARSSPARKNLSMMFFEGRIASTASLKFLEWNNVPRKFVFSLFVEIGEVLKSKIGIRVGSSSLHVRKTSVVRVIEDNVSKTFAYES